MKIVKILFGALTLAAMTMVAAPQLSAQENGNRDENGKVVQGPYLTKGLWDAWWIGAAGGITLFGDGGYNPAIGADLEVNVGKWFTPAVGARVGYQGLTGADWTKYASILGRTPVTSHDN